IGTHIAVGLLERPTAVLERDAVRCSVRRRYLEGLGPGAFELVEFKVGVAACGSFPDKLDFVASGRSVQEVPGANFVRLFDAATEEQGQSETMIDCVNHISF